MDKNMEKNLRLLVGSKSGRADKEERKKWITYYVKDTHEIIPVFEAVLKELDDVRRRLSKLEKASSDAEK